MNEMTEREKEMLSRLRLLLGDEKLDRLARARVIVLGLGGVGGWCAESLVRSGIRHLTIVDNDDVSITNCNRQLVATASTMGHSKAQALRDRLLDINPDAEVIAVEKTYSEETCEEFHLEQYDYVVDAIDSLKDKIHLVCHVTNIPENENGKFPVLFSSMGAALRTDPFSIRCAEFWKVRNDTLGAIMRKRMRQRKLMPGRKFMCVYSEELPQKNIGESNEYCSYKAQINGTISHVTAMFGFALAGMIVKEV